MAAGGTKGRGKKGGGAAGRGGPGLLHGECICNNDQECSGALSPPNVLQIVARMSRSQLSLLLICNDSMLQFVYKASAFLNCRWHIVIEVYHSAYSTLFRDPF